MGVSILSNVWQNGNIREVNCCGYLFVFAGAWEVIINIHLAGLLDNIRSISFRETVSRLNM